MLKNNRTLEQRFPVSNLIGNKAELIKFEKAIKKSREDGEITAIPIVGENFHCAGHNWTAPDNFEPIAVPILLFDGSQRFSLTDKKIFGKQIAQIVTVTPQMAWDWLVYHNNKNRDIGWADVDKYNREMKNGRWLLNPHGIVFCENGSMADSQHRLFAVILSGVSSEFWVFSGCTEEVKQVIDEGKKRTDRVIFETTEGRDVPTLFISTANFIDTITTKNKFKRSRPEKKQNLDEHIASIEFVDNIIKEFGDGAGKAKVKNTPLRAALSAIYYNLDDYEKYNTHLSGGAKERFEQFIKGIMFNSIQDRKKDQCIRNISDARVKGSHKYLGGGNRMFQLYDMVCGCGWHFLKNDEIGYVKASNPKFRNIFPIPVIF